MQQVKEFIHHFFLPRESNNHRSRLLHHSSLLVIAILFLTLQFFETTVETKYPAVLGISHSVTSDDLLLLTNIERQKQGLPVLQMNQALAKAAEAKAKDMFNKNYWAHNAPDGTTPWVFVKGSGYEYIYAGENLARGFTSAADVVKAWMESKAGHRENMLSKNYKDIGFAIMTGTLNGDETVLVVEMLGSTTSPFVARETTSNSIAPTPITKVAAVSQSPLPSVLPTVQPTIVPQVSIKPDVVVKAPTMPLVDSKGMAKNISFILVGLLVGILAIDLWVTEKNKIVRAVAHNMDHIIFLSVIFLAIFLFTKGIIV